MLFASFVTDLSVFAALIAAAAHFLARPAMIDQCTRDSVKAWQSARCIGRSVPDAPDQCDNPRAATLPGLPCVACALILLGWLTRSTAVTRPIKLWYVGMEPN